MVADFRTIQSKTCQNDSKSSSRFGLVGSGGGVTAILRQLCPAAKNCQVPYQIKHALSVNFMTRTIRSSFRELSKSQSTKSPPKSSSFFCYLVLSTILRYARRWASIHCDKTEELEDVQLFVSSMQGLLSQSRCSMILSRGIGSKDMYMSMSMRTSTGTIMIRCSINIVPTFSQQLLMHYYIIQVKFFVPPTTHLLCPSFNHGPYSANSTQRTCHSVSQCFL